MTHVSIPYGTIESEAVKYAGRGADQVQLSIAISLKRIADALTSEPTLAQSVAMAITEGIWNAHRSTHG